MGIRFQTEDARLNLSGKIEQPVLDELQKIIEKNDLVKKNVREDNDPLATWAEEIFELFRKTFIEMGYEQLHI